MTTGAERDHATISVPSRGAQPERQAKELPETVALSVVDETDLPAGAEPVHWRLLTTTQEIATVEQARQIVGWYRRRWTIEQVFRSLKTHGLRIEESQIDEAASFTKLAVVAFATAAPDR